MVEIISIILAAILHSGICFLTYNKELYNKWYFIPFGLFFSGLNSLVWLLTTRYFNDPKRLYIFSFAWDFIICSVYFLFPIFIAKIKLSRYELIGICIMALGLLVMKVKI